MKKKALSAFVIVLLFLSFKGPDAFAGKDSIKDKIKSASGFLLDRSSSCEQMQEALGDLLEASVHLMPQADYADEAKGKIEKAKRAILEDSIVSGEGRMMLEEAYALMNSGDSYTFPEEIESIENAVEYGKKLVDSIFFSLEKEDGGSAAIRLLEMVIMVVTPIHQ